MARRSKALLPPVSQLKHLSEESVQQLMILADRESERSSRYEILGMLCGTFSLMACVGSFMYLVMQGHEKAAAVVLGTAVLAVISRMVRGRTA